MQTCIVPNCGREGEMIRGLCPSCYQKARGMVADGLMTWERLQELGLAKPPVCNALTRALKTLLPKETDNDRLQP